MIQRIRLRGFQSHTDSTLELAPGLNVVTGPSDSGKTAIIRAIRWLAFGEPSGESYLNQAVGETQVTLLLDDGAGLPVEISKLRRGKKTYWSMTGHPDGWETAAIPDDIANYLGLSKQAFGDYQTALNFAYQLEAPFLISEAPSVGAKVLGKLSGTEVVDQAIKGVSKDTYAANEARRRADKEAQGITEQLKEFEDLSELQERLEVCETILTQLEADEIRLNRLDQQLIDYMAVSARVTDFTQRLDKLSNLPAIEEDLQKIEQAQQRYERLLDLYARLIKVNDTLEDVSQRLTSLQGIETLGATLDTLDANYIRYNTLTRLSTEYTGYSQALEKAETILDLTRDIDVAASGLGALSERQTRIEGLKKLQGDYGRADAQVWRYCSALEVTGGIDEARPLLERVVSNQGLKVKLQQHLGLLDVKSMTAANAFIKLQEACKAEARAKEELQELWGSLRECPLCERPLDGGDHIC